MLPERELLKLNNRHSGFDITVFILSILVITLHIDIDNIIINLIQQYIARIAVPFFFTLSGYFFFNSVNKVGIKFAFQKHFRRIGLLLVVFYILNLPIYLYVYVFSTGFSFTGLIILLQNTIFLTPGYLWYLSALLFAVTIFRFTSHIKTLLVTFIVTILYLIGILGNSYRDIVGLNFSIYYEIFLTTRNGLFFGYPLFTLGFYINKYKLLDKPVKPILFYLTIGLFFLEVYLVRNLVESSTDTSLYFSLPVIVFLFMYLSNQFKTNISSKVSLIFRKSSVIIYGSQYFTITVSIFALNFFGSSAFYKNITSTVLIIFIPLYSLIFTYM